MKRSGEEWTESKGKEVAVVNNSETYFLRIIGEASETFTYRRIQSIFVSIKYFLGFSRPFLLMKSFRPFVSIIQFKPNLSSFSVSLLNWQNVFLFSVKYICVSSRASYSILVRYWYFSSFYIVEKVRKI